MKCVICKSGETSPGEVTVTLQRGDTTVIIKQVPADVCDNCGEYYLNDKIGSRVVEQAEEALKTSHKARNEVEVLQFAA